MVSMLQLLCPNEGLELLEKVFTTQDVRIICCLNEATKHRREMYGESCV